jgi:hypothetical protein
MSEALRFLITATGLTLAGIARSTPVRAASATRFM